MSSESSRTFFQELVLLFLLSAFGACGLTTADHLLWQQEFAGDTLRSLAFLGLEFLGLYLGLAVLSSFVWGAFALTRRFTGIAPRASRSVQVVFLPLLLLAGVGAFDGSMGSSVKSFAGLAFLGLLALLLPPWIEARGPMKFWRLKFGAGSALLISLAITAWPVLARTVPLDSGAFNRQLILQALVGLPLTMILMRLIVSQRSSLWLALPGLLAAGAGVGAWYLHQPKREARDGKNIILVVCDTLRRDHVGLYGKGSELTPEIDAFFSEGVVFEDSYSPSSWTLPAMTSVFGQRMPRIRTDVHKGRHEVSLATETLAEALQSKGYATGAITANPLLVASTGLLRGFDDFAALNHHLKPDEPDRIPPLMQRVALTAGARLRPEPKRPYTDPNPEIVSGGLDWIDQREDERFLLWLHFQSPHDPYDPPDDLWKDEGYRGVLPRKHFSPNVEGPNAVYMRRGWSPMNDEDKEHVRRLYRAETRGIDRELGKLFEGIEERGLLENTIVVLISDHGEEFWEHGDFYHGHSLFRELCEVAFLVRAPGIDKGRVPGVASTLDLVPTLKELVGVESEGTEPDGQSLVEQLRTKVEAGRPVHSAEHREHLYAIRDDKWCAIYSPFRKERFLFDRQSDPEEQHNVADERPEIFELYLPQLLEIHEIAWKRAQEELASTPEGEDLNAEMNARMRAIGYGH